MKPLLVGISPNTTPDDTPFSGTGKRAAARLIGVGTFAEFREHFDVLNLLPGRTRSAGVEERKSAALEVLARVFFDNGWNRRPIVLVGQPVYELVNTTKHEAQYYSVIARNSVGAALYVMPDPDSLIDSTDKEKASEFLKRLGRMLVR